MYLLRVMLPILIIARLLLQQVMGSRAAIDAIRFLESLGFNLGESKKLRSVIDLEASKQEEQESKDELPLNSTYLLMMSDFEPGAQKVPGFL